MSAITVNAYAKINPSLDVLGKRPDGYHEVNMVMQLLELHDFVMADWTAAPGSGMTIALSSDHPDVPCDETNLAWRAAEEMAAVYLEKRGEHPGGHLMVHIKKHIPVAAGLAGGSADGAAVLHALNVLFGLRLSLPELCPIGARLGADVPFALRGQAYADASLGLTEDLWATPAARATGTGTALTGLPPIAAQVLLHTPPLAVATKDAYRGVDAADTRLPLTIPVYAPAAAEEETAKEATEPCGFLVTKRPDMDAVLAAIYKQDLFSAREKMGNTLEFYTLKRYHEVAYTKYKMQEACPDGVVLMSGSGPTVFCLMQEEDPERAAKAIRPLSGQTLLTRTVR